MAWTHRTLTNAADLLTKFKEFVSGSIGAVTGVRTGTGRIVRLEVRPGVVSENWVITCITAVANGGVFSVVGSVSGAQPDATVGTQYSNDFISFLLTDAGTDFAVADTFLFTTAEGGLAAQAWEVITDTANGIGTVFDYLYLRKVVQLNGVSSNFNGSLNAFQILNGYFGNETWVLTALTATTFSVVGSVTGNIGTATINVPFVHSGLSFTIAGSSQPPVAGDTFTITHTNPAAGGARRIMVFRSRGLSGADDNLYHTYVDEYFTSTDRWLLAVRTHSAYQTTIDTYAQANMTPVAKRIRLIDGSMPARFIADGRSAKMLVQSDVSARQCNYSGFYLPHADASLAEYPFPAFTGGCGETTDAGTPAGYAGGDYYAFFTGQGAQCGAVALPSNSWSNISRGSYNDINIIRTLPWSAQFVDYFSGVCFGDTSKKDMMPSIIVCGKTGQEGILGEFDGVKFVAAQSGSLSALDILTEDGVDWIVWNSPKQTSSRFYAAFELSGDEFV